MNAKTKRLTLCSVLAALSVAILYISGLIPVTEMSLAGLAGIATAVSAVHCGNAWALAVYVVTALLSLVLTADKSAAILYTIFLGYYPIIKNILEKRFSKKISIVLKLIILNGAMGLEWVIFKKLFGIDNMADWMPVVYFALLNVSFILYDYALTGLKWKYIQRMGRYIDPQVNKK